MESLSEIRQAIETVTGSPVQSSPLPLTGSCLHDTFRLGDCFIKHNPASAPGMFTSEAAALDEIRSTNTVRVPQVITSGEHFLALEYLNLTSAPQEDLGRQLAQLHNTTHSHFGWSRDNYIGTTPQKNTPTKTWVDFFRESRLLPLLAKLPTLKNSHQLIDSLDQLLPHHPTPALLHGDLWGGNAAGLPNGTAVIFDPATYYGDPEADLAMTQLFGGFSPNFYDAYHEIRPALEDHQRRATLYNLYHALLFGSSYLAQAQSMIRELTRSSLPPPSA